jgi:small conductance mechanosensitive channel
MADVNALLPLIVGNALNALGAILILLIGLWLSGRASLLVVRMLRRTPHVDPMLQSFFGSLARYLVLTVTVLAVLSEFGIQTTSLVAILGAASLAVGLALQGTLSNLAAGVMLLIFRPFPDRSQGADRRQQRRHGQRAVAILDRAGHRRQSAGDRAKQRRLGSAPA